MSLETILGAFGDIRAGRLSRQDTIDLVDEPDLTDKEIEQIAEEILPYYYNSLETQTRVGKVESPFSETPVRLTKLHRHYLTADWSSPTEIAKLGTISFSSEELKELAENSPELVPHIKGIEISDTHELFDETDPENIVLKPEFAEIFSRMESLEHLGLERIFPKSYIDHATGIDVLEPGSNNAERRRDYEQSLRLPHLNSIINLIPRKVSSLKIDTTDPCYEGDDLINHNRNADLFLNDIFRNKNLSDVTQLDICAKRRLLVFRSMFTSAVFFNNLTNLRLVADHADLPFNENFNGEALDRVLTFPRLRYLESRLTSFNYRYGNIFHFIDSRNAFTLNIVNEGIPTDEVNNAIKDLDYLSRTGLFYNGEENNCRSLKINGQYSNEGSALIQQIVQENLKGSSTVSLVSDEMDMSPELFDYIRQCGYSVELEHITEGNIEDVSRMILERGIRVTSIRSNTDHCNFYELLESLVDSFGPAITPQTPITIATTLDEIPRESRYFEYIKGRSNLVVCLLHNMYENYDIELEVDDSMDSLDLRQYCENYLEEIGSKFYLPYPEIEIQGAKVDLDAFGDRSIQIEDNGESVNPLDLRSVIEDLYKQASKEYLSYYKGLRLEGFEITGEVESFDEIENIKLSYCDFELEDLVEFLRSFPCLKNLNLVECSFEIEEALEYVNQKLNTDISNPNQRGKELLNRLFSLN